MTATARARLEAGFAARRRHDTEAAYAAIAEAAVLAPDDAEAALALAHISYETWRPAADAFARAQALDPANASIACGHARALAAEGQRTAAETLLEALLRCEPTYVEGQRTLATIRATAGDPTFDRGFAEGCRAAPDDRPLRFAWFHMLATARRWEAARRVLDAAAMRWGAIKGVLLGRAFLASESDAASRDPRIFDAVADVDDFGLDLARVRFWLRLGEPSRAVAIAQARIAGPAGRMFQPYLDLAHRLAGREVAYEIGVFDTPIDLAPLERVLRHLLAEGVSFHEQSVRGGVQTDRHLFFNPLPEIQHFRAKMADYVRRSTEGEVRFEGSWAVLLRGRGFHAPHTHPNGWLGSAFYVAVPRAEGDQGKLALGAPPPELGLSLAPTCIVDAKPGRLVLFPATAWHGTLPFDDGERLTIAFDVAGPR